VYYLVPSVGGVVARLSNLLGMLSKAIGESFCNHGYVVLVLYMVGYCDCWRRLYWRSLKLAGICGLS
jgi:hypothetical protein